MIEYTYTFERMDAELSATVTIQEPIPHIAVGASLNIVNDHLALSLDKVFVVRHIETMIAAIEPPKVPRVHVQVWIEQAPRPDFLPRR